MRSPGATAATIAIGALLAGLYLLVAYAVVQLLLFPLVGRLRPVPTLLLLAGAAVVSGYVSYRVGVGRLLAGLRTREVTERDAPALFARLDRLCETMGVRRPRVLLADLDQPNALSVGGRRGVIVLDRQLPSLLSPAELDAILAHELAHLAGRDGFVRTLGASFVDTVRALLFVLLLPAGLLALALQRFAAALLGVRRVSLSAHLLRTYVAVGLLSVAAMGPFTLALRAYSRRQELAADDRAAEATDPRALARGLAKIRRAARAREGPFSSLFIYGDQEGSLTRWLATHPPMDERIERLRERARERMHRIPVG